MKVESAPQEFNNYIDLSSLPPNHQLRNCKLKDIQAECKNLGQKLWRDISTWKIGNNTYNELGETWIKNNNWRGKDIT